MGKQHDHAGLAAWYKQKAGHLRAHAEEMRQMVKNYEGRMTKPSIVNLSHFVQKIGSFSFHNLLIIQHSGCEFKVE